MATPEEVDSQSEGRTSELRLLSGLAVGGEATIVPVEQPLITPFDSVLETQNEAHWADMSREELLAVRECLSAYRGQMSNIMLEASQQHDRALEKQIWVNRLLRDKPSSY